MTDVLILGCGYIGKRAAARWLANGRSVAALTRGNAAELEKLGIEPIVGDVCDPATLQNLPRARTVLHAIGLDRTSGRSMREVYVQGLANVLTALPEPERLIHVSSTSVYGQTDGGWVNEESSTEPVEDSGRIVLDAERLLKRAIILRFAGIYGPGRLLRKQALMNGEPLVGDCEKWLNLIHRDDGADAILAAEAKAEPGSVFNIADGSPVSRREFYTHWAKLLGAPEAKFDHKPEPGAANRRIAIDKAKRELGWSPRVASYRDGLDGLS
ncbi:MAG: SDR family oxidoreductase [Gemmataceae bacterium]